MKPISKWEYFKRNHYDKAFYFLTALLLGVLFEITTHDYGRWVWVCVGILVAGMVVIIFDGGRAYREYRRNFVKGE